MEAKIINFGEALVLTAQKDILDFEGKPRVTGEQWLVAKPGAYLLGPYETLIFNIPPTIYF
ncbi:unnamed protein product [Protopolystoma xenopodis]|uniref:Major vault protein repeat domain-containing protein n=1 Tax=Protopolystoma xenopodis TaxID=117903 RepID=A0A448WYU4_9PLAT|nr:unnamed protein product [Protopolystoma xenopodis]